MNLNGECDMKNFVVYSRTKSIMGRWMRVTDYMRKADAKRWVKRCKDAYTESGIEIAIFRCEGSIMQERVA